MGVGKYLSEDDDHDSIERSTSNNTGVVQNRGVAVGHR
jgi:hypothetical protein